MASYQTILTTRATPPDWASLLASLRMNVDPATGFVRVSDTEYRVKKPTAWTAPQIAAAQAALDTAPASTPQLTAQNEIDNLSIHEKALVLTIIDELNRLRTQPSTSFPAFTPEQAIAAMRAKAATL